MPFSPIDLTSQGNDLSPFGQVEEQWLAIFQQACEFPPHVFLEVALNLIRNPNINSSFLFRADILYDGSGSTSQLVPAASEPTDGSHIRSVLQEYSVHQEAFLGFELVRTVVRRMVPRNPERDDPLDQTCQIFRSISRHDKEQTVVIYIPHVSSRGQIPFYHPVVRCLAYLHTWHVAKSHNYRSSLDLSLKPKWRLEELQSESLPDSSPMPSGNVSIHYRFFPDDSISLVDDSASSGRLRRTALHLLSTLYKHGQGALAGYTKRVDHDQILSQQRTQDTYTRLKSTHAKRLCNNWVEKTDPSKHVFEDLSIAAFLIELWKDMYRSLEPKITDQKDSKEDFPGFVDIGCGNGVLVDILLKEGYKGWGFDARGRKTWSTFDSATRRQLKQLILIPQPLIELDPKLREADNKSKSQGLLSRLSSISASPIDKVIGSQTKWFNGIFPQGTFLIANHSDELIPWTPLLASLSSSPFLAIPCCSFNLSGHLFRAPSKFTSYTADALAPSFFAANKTKSKSVAITIDSANYNDQQPKQGSLRDLSCEERAKQPSAYQALCDWVVYLAQTVGYVVEKEWLRIPSTRNLGLVGRGLQTGFLHDDIGTITERVKLIVEKEGTDGMAWTQRARGLTSRKGAVH
ncbi:MAG: hypothetical protein LQ351_002062 [Letrouitia transgressa]|nr:MAG: hypothetical protein LQ351_002062 [Letrouitia transgressa]